MTPSGIDPANFPVCRAVPQTLLHRVPPTDTKRKNCKILEKGKHPCTKKKTQSALKQRKTDKAYI
jgi:hypothetical protein